MPQDIGRLMCRRSIGRPVPNENGDARSVFGGGVDDGAWSSLLAGGFDVVVGADVVYKEELMEPLLSSIEQLCHPTPPDTSAAAAAINDGQNNEWATTRTTTPTLLLGRLRRQADPGQHRRFRLRLGELGFDRIATTVIRPVGCRQGSERKTAAAELAECSAAEEPLEECHASALGLRFGELSDQQLACEITRASRSVRTPTL